MTLDENGRFLYYTPTTEIGAEFDEIRQELGNLRQVVQRQTLLSSVQSASSRTCESNDEVF